MRKEDSEVNMTAEDLTNISSALFQIHAFANLLQNQLVERSLERSADNQISNGDLSLSEVISEKAEFCLKTIGAV